MPRASDIEVDIPGVGLVYFPPDMSMEAIRAKSAELSKVGLTHQHNLNRAAEADTQHGQVAVDAKMIAEPVRMIGIAGGPVGAAYSEAKAQQIEQAGGAREEMDPLAIGAQAAIPGAVKAVGKAARPIAKRLYAGALKLPTVMKMAKRESILETGLNEGRIATTRSIEKSQGRLKQIEQEIDAKIATRPEAPIDSQAVASRVDEIAPRFETVNPEADKAILQGAKEEFIRNYPSLGAGAAQELKKKTYKVLGEKAYGEQKTAAKESQKALARGLKEELEVHFPELKQLNRSAGALIDLNKALERAAARVGNRDVMGIGVPIKTEAFGKPGLIMGLLDSPGIKQRLAIAIDKARHLQKASPTATAAIGRGATVPSLYEEE